MAATALVAPELPWWVNLLYLGLQLSFRWQSAEPTALLAVAHTSDSASGSWGAVSGAVQHDAGVQIVRSCLIFLWECRNSWICCAEYVAMPAYGWQSGQPDDFQLLHCTARHWQAGRQPGS